MKKINPHIKLSGQIVLDLNEGKIKIKQDIANKYCLLKDPNLNFNVL